MEKRAPIEEVILALVEHFDIHHHADRLWTEADGLLNKIADKDPDCRHRLSQAIESWSLYDYIKKDRELKIKMSDVWESEVIRLRQNYHRAYDELLDYMEAEGIGIDQS